jgi:uncharacterized membrane protein YkoI
MTIYTLNKHNEFRPAPILRAAFTGLLLCSSMVLSSMAVAQKSDQNLQMVNPNERSLIAQELMSSKQAAQIATNRAGGGRVIDVQPLRSNEAGYRVKLFKEGTVRTIIVRD